jgi:hypothetical protein
LFSASFSKCAALLYSSCIIHNFIKIHKLCFKHFVAYRLGSQNVVRPHQRGRGWSSGWRGGSWVVYMRDIFILNEICAQDKINISVGTSLGLNVNLALLYNLNFTKLRRICYSVLSFM